MSTLYPRMNLSPEATPWGRLVQQKLDELELAAERRAQGELNTNKAQNGTLGVLSRAIAQLVAVAADSANTENYTIPTSYQDKATVEIPVPEGYTKALVTATASASGFNNSGATAYLNVAVKIDGTYNHGSSSSRVENLAFDSANSTFYMELSDLAGGSISVSAATRVINAAGPPFVEWAATSSNEVTIYAQAIFLK